MNVDQPNVLVPQILTGDNAKSLLYLQIEHWQPMLIQQKDRIKESNRENG